MSDITVICKDMEILNKHVKDVHLSAQTYKWLHFHCTAALAVAVTNAKHDQVATP